MFRQDSEATADSPIGIARRDIEEAMWRHAVDAWFPRCIDRQYGGFICDFDRQWRPGGNQVKSLEFQARQTWFAAAALETAPDHPDLRESALHGLRYLEGPMWDSRDGGWFHRLDRAGVPQELGSKHTHGAAYAIAAASAVARALDDRSALELAQTGFEWLESNARDRENGGYFGPLARDGAPIVAVEECPWFGGLDLIGTPIGLKDANVHNDLLEAFCLLESIWGDARVPERLREIADFLTVRLTRGDGGLRYFECPEGERLSDYVQYGHCFQSSYRVMRTRALLGEQELGIEQARRMIDFALAEGRGGDSHGFNHSNLNLPGQPPAASKKWWVQFEAFHALAEICAALPRDSGYVQELVRVWDFLQAFQFDQRHAGVFLEPLADLPWWRRAAAARFAPRSKTRKGSEWKYVAHEGHALLAALRLSAAPDRNQQLRP